LPLEEFNCLERFSLGSRGGSRVVSLRKRESLEEDFILRIISIDLYKLDLSKVLRGDPLTYLCTISQNRISIKNRALINTRANGFVFVNSLVIGKTSRYLGVLIRPLS